MLKFFCSFFFFGLLKNSTSTKSEEQQRQQEAKKRVVIITVPSGKCVWITPRRPLTWLRVNYTWLTAERRESSICVCVCVREGLGEYKMLTSIENLNDISLYSTSFSVILWELIGSWRALIKGVALFTNMEVFIRQRDFKCDINPLFIIAPVSVYCNPQCAAWFWCGNWRTLTELRAKQTLTCTLNTHGCAVWDRHVHMNTRCPTSLRREAQQVCFTFQTTAATSKRDRKQLERWEVGFRTLVSTAPPWKI